VKKLELSLHIFKEEVAVAKNLNHPVLIKAKEMADAIQQSEEFKEKDISQIQLLIIKCNKIITETIKINYGEVCRPRSGCC
jgi:hypothetical protein